MLPFYRLLLLLILALTTHCQNAPSKIVRFSKKIYSSLGPFHGRPWNATAWAEGFKGEYDKLNTDGTLGSSLKALYDMRTQDLQVSLLHTRNMLQVLYVLDP
jgi:hypothetical protein